MRKLVTTILINTMALAMLAAIVEGRAKTGKALARAKSRLHRIEVWLKKPQSRSAASSSSRRF